MKVSFKVVKKRVLKGLSILSLDHERRNGINSVTYARDIIRKGNESIELAQLLRRSLS